MRSLREPRSRWAAAVKAAAFCLLLAVALPAAAQEMISTGGVVPFDRARVSGFAWHGDVNGTLFVPALEEIPGYRRGVDTREDLGMTSGSTGWLVDADLGLAARHRVLFSFSGMSHSGTGELAISATETLLTSSAIDFRDVSGAYEFLYFRRDWIRAGAIAGVGYVKSNIDVVAFERPEFGQEEGPRVAEASDVFASAYPLIGGSVMLDAEVINIYVEINGSPSITVGDQSGSLLNIDIDFVVYPTPTIGVIAGYKRYSLTLGGGEGTGIDLVWDGFIVGGQYVF